MPEIKPVSEVNIYIYLLIDCLIVVVVCGGCYDYDYYDCVFGSSMYCTHHCTFYITLLPLFDVVIRGLAVGTITDANTRSFLRKEVNMGICLSLILGTAGCIRAAIFLTPMLETFAITTSLFMIVSISIVLGAVLPLGMKRVRIDPAHSSTTIQVIMDILGVTITVWVCRFVYWLSASWSSGSLMDA